MSLAQRTCTHDFRQTTLNVVPTMDLIVNYLARDGRQY